MCLQLSSCIVDSFVIYKYEAITMDGKRVNIQEIVNNKVYIDNIYSIGDTVMFHSDTGNIYDSEYCKKAVITKLLGSIED